MKLKKINLMICCLGLWALAQAQDIPPPPEEQETTVEAPVAKADSGTAGIVQAFDFKYQKNASKLIVKFDKETQFEKTTSDSDKQIILEFKNAKIGSKFSRKLDTSSFKSNVVLVSPYQSGANVRVVLQLKEMADIEVTNDGTGVIATISNKISGAGNSDASDIASKPITDQNTEPPTEQTAEQTAELPTEQASEPTSPSTEAPTTEKVEVADGNIGEFIKSQETKHYAGRKISLQLKDADLADVFQAISAASEFNIILGDDVKGRMTFSLTDVPWDQALDIILKTNKLAAERNGNVLRVVSLDAMTREKQAELANQKAVDAVEPLVVKIFPISYAKIDDLKKIIDDFISQDSQMVSALSGASGMASAASAASAAKRGSIQVDTRTNSLVVRDTATSIEKIKRIIKELDTQTPQVLIEAKFVGVSEGKNKEVGGRIFSTTRESDATGGMTFPGLKTNFASVFSGATGGSGLPSTFSSGLSTSPGGTFGISPKFGIIPGISDEFGAFLSFLESENNAKIIATPRIITQNKEPAEINQGQSFVVPGTAGNGATAAPSTINAVLSLKVTPQVTSEGSINLKVTFSQDSPSSASVAGASISLDTKKIDTNVLIESGNTLVLGGIYSSSMIEGKAGIPILRDIPILGWFFGSKKTASSKEELFIFITPRIVNEKESGIGAG